MELLPNNSGGLTNMHNLGRLLWDAGILNSDKSGQNIAMIRFIHGTAQKENPYNGVFMRSVGMRESLKGLRDFLSYDAKSGSNNCIRYGDKSSSQSRCSSYVSEIRAVKNYAESVLD